MIELGCVLVYGLCEDMLKCLQPRAWALSRKSAIPRTCISLVPEKRRSFVLFKFQQKHLGISIDSTIPYARKYGKWYFENEDYFCQSLDLKQGELSIVEYSDQFLRLKDERVLEDDEEYDLTSFLKCLRSDIVERMNHCKTIYEAYWEAYLEAIRAKNMPKWSHLGRVTPQEGQSSRIIADHIVEPHGK